MHKKLNKSCSLNKIFLFLKKHNGKPLHDRERLVRQSLKNISRASLDVSGCPSLGIFWVFGGLWGSLGVFGDLWGFDLLKVRLFSSHARCDFLVFSCKVHKTFWFLIQDEIWVFLSYMRLLVFLFFLRLLADIRLFVLSVKKQKQKIQFNQV